MKVCLTPLSKPLKCGHMKDQLKRILKLIQKTGDTMIVTDPNGEDVYVVMGLDAYEDLRESTDFKDENKEDWNSFEDDDQIFEDESESEIQKQPDIWHTMQSAKDEGETWNLADLSDEESEDLKKQYEKYAQEESEPDVSVAQTEGVSSVFPPKLDENSDEFGEEQFYLEPIE